MGVNFDVIKRSYGWSIGSDGQLYGLVAGDMGYEPTGIFLEGDEYDFWMDFMEYLDEQNHS